MTDSRLYQQALEALLAGDSSARAYQQAVETLLAGDSSARAYQQAIETLVAGDSAARSYQQAVEVLVEVTTTLTVAPTAIASAQAMGSPTVNPRVNPTGIASAQAFGSPTVVTNQFIAPSSIGSQQTFGAPVVSGDSLPQSITPTGITSGQAFGSPALVLNTLFPSSIVSRQAFGIPSFSQVRLSPTGIPSAQAVGTPSVGRSIKPTSILSAYATGFPKVAGPVTVTGIPSQQAVGTPSIVGPQRILPTGIPSAEVVSPVRLPGPNQTITAQTIVSQQAFGVPFVGQPQSVFLSPIVSRETFGEVALRAVIKPNAILPQGKFGFPTVGTGSAALLPTAIVSLTAVGTVVVTLGAPTGVVAARVRKPNRLRDDSDGRTYDWIVNHTTEDAVSYKRQSQRGATNTNVGFVRQQQSGGALLLRVQGTLLTASEKAELELFYSRCLTNSLRYRDWTLEEWEVVISSLDVRRERVGRNPRMAGGFVWRYTLDFEVLKAIAGPTADAGILV